MLTWREKTVLTFDESLNLVSQQAQWAKIREGWGITSIDNTLYVSDGTSYITRVNAETMTTIDQIQVTYKDGQYVNNLNELEYCPHDGLIYANIWYRDMVIAINPVTGQVEK